MNQEFLRLRDVQAITRLSRATIYRLSNAKKFPQPVKLTDRGASAWVRDEINEWVAERIAASRKAA